jgi:glycine/serine hydroxymethyltransferase
MGVAEMEHIADFIYETLSNAQNEVKLKVVADSVRELSAKFPLYRHRLTR